MVNESPRWNWAAKIAIPVLAVALSMITSWTVTLYTTNSILRDRTEQGRIIFESIGYRYFYSLYDVILLFRRPKLKEDDHEYVTDHAAHLAVLEDIQQDIQWLRTNPMYWEDEHSVFPFIQNHLIKEVIKDERLGYSYTTLHMCNLYMNSDWEKSADNQLERAVVAAARQICCEVEFPLDIVPDCVESPPPSKSQIGMKDG